MKRASLLLLLPAIVFFTSACEKHSVSELAKLEESEGEHEGAAGHERNPQSAHEQAREKAAESSPAPKFFSR